MIDKKNPMSVGDFNRAMRQTIGTRHPGEKELAEIRSEAVRPKQLESPTEVTHTHMTSLRMPADMWADFKACCYINQKFPSEVIRELMVGYVRAAANARKKT